MSFQILNSNNEAISLGLLDQEAAAFWGKELKDRQYANPTPLFTNDANLQGIELTRAMARYEFSQWSNWFDMVGWNIHHPQTNYTTGWDNVKCSMWAVQAYSLYKHIFGDEEHLKLHIEAAKAYLKPYFDLVDHWASKGYTPVQVKD